MKFSEPLSQSKKCDEWWELQTYLYLRSLKGTEHSTTLIILRICSDKLTISILWLATQFLVVGGTNVEELKATVWKIWSKMIMWSCTGVHVQLLTFLIYLLWLTFFFFVSKGLGKVEMKGLWDRVHIQLYYLFALADLFFMGKGKKEKYLLVEISVLIIIRIKKKSLSCTPKLRHLLYEGKSPASKCDKDKRYFCVCCFVRLLNLLQFT